MAEITTLLRGPWAVPPDRLREIQTIHAAHTRGDKIDLDAVEARLGRPLRNEPATYEVRAAGVAVLPIEGILAPKLNLLLAVSGGQSTQMLAQQVESMRTDSAVRAVVLAVDSSGGSVLGVPALVDAVRALAAAKPTVTVSTGTMTSAAYWIGSAANAVFAEGLTDLIGSIGVVATHDYEPRAGRVRTEVTAGRYKRIASSAAPLSDEGRAYLQQLVDENYRVFVDAVATHRRVAADTVLERMADGRVFVAGTAMERGLIDGIATVDAMVERLAMDPRAYVHRRRATFGIRPPLFTPPGARALGFGASRGAVPLPKELQVAIAQRYAQAHGVDFIAAMKHLTFAA